ncbi:MAG: hypothetical protein J7M27_07180 [Candidatus Latescibacteria bacterium]|nr:hypothetical protein [Candidatus Latescibacterota bacterium]
MANFCFLTKETNLEIGDRLPEEYFSEIQENHPGALESQWIPLDSELWKIENYPAFLEVRKQLLADEANKHLTELLHGETHWLEAAAPVREGPVVLGSISDEEEERELEAINNWMFEMELPTGELSYEYSDPDSGQ